MRPLLENLEIVEVIIKRGEERGHWGSIWIRTVCPVRAASKSSSLFVD